MTLYGYSLVDNLPMHLAQDRHPRGVLIGEPVSKAQWIFDDDAYKELLSKLHRHVR